jgi:hypothetical protein
MALGLSYVEESPATKLGALAFVGAFFASALAPLFLGGGAMTLPPGWINQRSLPFLLPRAS